MLIQLALVIFIALIYVVINKDLNLFLYCLYGGFISVSNAWLINRILNKQKKIKIHSANIGLKIMVASVVTRFILVALLVLIGIKLNFEPIAILLGLSFGQIGLVVDTLKNKTINTNKLVN